jgi:hypothetical protein
MKACGRHFLSECNYCRSRASQLDTNSSWG